MINLKLITKIFFFCFIILVLQHIISNYSFSQQPFGNLNMIFDDGTIMIYKGSEDGIKVGDIFEVKRVNKTIGKIEITKVDRLFSYAKEITSTEKFKELDFIVKIKEKSSVEKQKETGEKEVAKVEKENLGEDSSEKKKIIEEEKPQEKTKKETKNEKIIKKDEKSKSQKVIKKKISPQTTFGLNGLVINYNDEILPLNGAAIYSKYLSSNKYDLSAIAFGFSYGATENIEFSVNRFKYVNGKETTYNDVTSFSLKYVPKTNQQLIKNYNVKYNGSFCYFSSSGESGVKISLNASSKYLRGKIHGNLYGLLGDLPENYKGISFSGGYEYNLNENLSLLLEYDHRFLPFLSYRTPSISVRYNSENALSIDLSFIDFNENKIISAGGSYSF